MGATAFSSRLSAFACGMTALLGGLVLLGWIFKSPALTAFIAGGPPTPVPTALLLLVASAALWLLRQRRRAPLAAVLAAAVLLLGVLGLAESWLHYSSGIQEGITRLFLAVPTHVAASMLPHATLAFVLLGAALLILASDGGRRPYLAQAFALAVMVLALQAMLSLIFRMETLPAGAAVPGMALPAAVCFLLLGAGTLFLRPGQGLAAILLDKGPGGALLRFIVPVVLIVPNGLILLALSGLPVGHYGGGFVSALLALLWVSVIMAMFFALGIYLNRKGEALALSEQRYRVAAHELKLTNQLMERIFSNIHALVAYLDTDFNFIRVNENYAAAADQQRAPDFFVGKNHFLLYPNMENEAIFRRVLESGEPYIAYAKPFEYPGQTGRGVTYWDWNLTPVKDENGKIEGLLLTLADVTENVKLQALDTLFNEIDQQVLRGLPLPGLLKFICGEVARLLDYQFVWIGHKEAGGEISISASAGTEDAYHHELVKIGVRWDDTPQGHDPAGQSIRLGQIRVFRFSEPGFQLWREAAERFSLKSAIGIPLIIRGEVYGAFTLYSRHEQCFDDPATVQRLGMIAGRICIALEMAVDQQQLRLLGTALASAGNGVFITDRRGRIQWLNQSFTRLTGYSAQEALGETPRIIKSGKQGADYYHKLWQTITAGEVWSSETVEKRKDGSEFMVQQTITPIRDASGEVTHFISILEDITAQKATEARIQHLAHYDALTDLPNRALFYDRLRQVLAQARRGNHPSALMFLDLDRFKTVNDTLGHHIGDLLLQEVAERIRSCVRETDTVARLGGDEFTLLLPQVVDRESAAIVARKIIAVFAEPFVLDGHELRTSTSIGIALYPLDTDDCDKLVKLADNAMYEAKQRGRNNYCFFDVSSESL